MGVTTPCHYLSPRASSYIYIPKSREQLAWLSTDFRDFRLNELAYVQHMHWCNESISISQKASKFFPSFCIASFTIDHSQYSGLG